MNFTENNLYQNHNFTLSVIQACELNAEDFWSTLVDSVNPSREKFARYHKGQGQIFFMVHSVGSHNYQNRSICLPNIFSFHISKFVLQVKVTRGSPWLIT